MDIVAFAIWKFRNIEGLLRGMYAFDVNTTKYVDPVSGTVSWIRYDYGTERATIECTRQKDAFWAFSGVGETMTVDCGFSELQDKLCELGMYSELDRRHRHALAGMQADE